MKIIYKQDWDKVCATYDDFINLQESPAWFWGNEREAKRKLLSQRTIKLDDIIYGFNKKKIKVEECIVIWVYNLEKVNQNKDTYFFDAPKQLIACVSISKSGDGSTIWDYTKWYLDNWKFAWPIDKYHFKDIFEVFSDIYIDKDDAQEQLDVYMASYKKDLILNEKIKGLEAQISALREDE